MRYSVFAQRNTKEILRDPVNLAFGIGFPLILMLLLSAIQANIPVSLFEIANLAPGLSVFGLSFIALFSGTLIAKDRSTSLMMRLFTSPLTASDFIFGYTIPLLPMSILQSVICYLAAAVLGLPINVNVLIALIVQIPTAIIFISLGLLCGTVLNDKQVGGICGAILTNVSAWLSGTWFDLNLVGGAFKTIAYALPFAHAVDAGKAAINGDYASIFPHLWWVISYAVIVTAIAVIVFKRKMRSDQF